MIRAVHGDAANLQELLDGELVACVVTSPPYNAGMPYDGVSDRLSLREYRAKVLLWADAIRSVMMPAARLFLNVPTVLPLPKEYDAAGQRWSPAHEWHTACRIAGLTYRDTIAWVKPIVNDTSWGSWRKPSAPNYRGRWEQVQVWFKGSAWLRSAPLDYGGEDPAADAVEWAQLMHNVWPISPARRLTGGHPAPMPRQLAENAIVTATWPGETVLDPFMGSGTTLHAAHELGRSAIGIDLSRAYVDEFNAEQKAVV